MEITREQAGPVLELRISGRLDAYWADTLSGELEEALRGGADRICLRMGDVTFLSSAGLRVLLVYFQKLNAMDGSLTIREASEPAKEVLDLAGFDSLFLEEAPPAAPAVVAPAAPAATTLDRPTARFETFELARGAAMKAELIGDPQALLGCSFGKDACRTVAFPETAMAVGLGAFGRGYDDCRDRFGEFLAVAGSAAYLPTDGTNVVDYLTSSGAFVPELQVLYAIRCEGEFSHLARFEAKPASAGNGAGGPVPLSELAAAALEIAGADAAAVVIVAESAGLVGAAVRKSPTSPEGALAREYATAEQAAAASGKPLAARESALFGFPGVRRWLSFTPERAFDRALTLVVGVVTRVEGTPLAPALRPLAPHLSPSSQSAIAAPQSKIQNPKSKIDWGHFHAAAFSYRPLKRGLLDLKTTAGTLFDAEDLQGVLHLLNDHREISGAGESEFVRGAMWVSALHEVTA